MTTLSMTRGDTAAFTITVTRSGSAENITGATLYFTVKSNSAQADAAAIIQKSTVSGITITNGAGGIASVAITPANTSSVTPGVYYYDVQYRTTGGDVYTVDSGYFLLQEEITAT